jgi:competence protein ComGC
MKAYHHHQRGLTLLEVSIAISVALAVLLSFAPYHIKLMERGLVEQTAQRTKMVYEAAINYRLDNDNGDWPQSTAVLKEAGYLPDVARQTSWGDSIALGFASNGLDLEMKFSLPEMRFVNAVAAKLPVPKISGLEITQLIVRPGQEESLSQLQDLAGIRAWTGSHNADNNDLNKVGTLTAKFIATNQEVTLGASCSPATEDEKKNKPGKGGRAMIKLADGVFAPVFCDGTKWVREAQMAMSQCKVCIACKQKHPGSKTDEIAEKSGSWFRGACDYPDDDGWAVARDHLSGCGSNGRGLLQGLAGKHTQGINLAIKFVCGPDKTAGKFPSIQGSNKWATWQYHPSDQTNPEEYVTDEDK